MRAVVSDRAGGPEVLRIVEREVSAPGVGEVRVRIRVSGVNPTDWKSRSGTSPRAAGAHESVDYRAEDATARIRALAPDGVDLVVEVNPTANAALDTAVLRPGGTIAVSATDTAEPLAIDVRPSMGKNVVWRFLLTYTVPAAEKAAAVEGVRAAVEAGTVGKVLIDV